MLSILLACTATPLPDTSGHTGETGQTHETGHSGTHTDTATTSIPAEAQHVFSFALVADPHVTSEGEHAERLRAAVAWINERAETDPIELCFILGDIAWHDGWTVSTEILGELTVPWVPVFGDNPYQVGEEVIFHQTFGPQLDVLSGKVDDWEAASVPVDHVEYGVEAWLHNVRLDHRGVRFIVLDWNTRLMDAFWGETPDLHDFEGGTLPWLQSALEDLPDGPDERVVLLSHMPLFEGFGGLEADEVARYTKAIEQHADTIHGNYAGHLHGDSDSTWDAIGQQVVVTDATWDDENTVRLVEVWSDELRFTYVSESFEVD